MNGLQKLELYPKDLSFEQLFGRLGITINHSSGQITYVIPNAEYFGAFWVDSPTIAPTNLSSTLAQIRKFSLLQRSLPCWTHSALGGGFGRWSFHMSAPGRNPVSTWDVSSVLNWWLVNLPPNPYQKYQTHGFFGSPRIAWGDSKCLRVPGNSAIVNFLGTQRFVGDLTGSGINRARLESPGWGVLSWEHKNIGLEINPLGFGQRISLL